MYWQCNHQSSPQIEIVLAKDDLTLNEVLEQENILQELKSPNIKLIEFITRSDILSELISLIIEEPSTEVEEHERYKLPNLACEVLTTDVPRLNESLLDVALLTKLYSFLEKDPPLNPLLASYFSRTLSLLICRKSDQNWYSYQFTCLSVLDFLKSKDDSLKLLLKHLGTSAIMDLTLKLITQVEGKEMQQNLHDWLENEHLVDRIIELFHYNVESDRHNNAAQLLSDTIKQLLDQDNSEKDHSKPDPILSSLQSTETIQKLLGEILDGDELCESAIVGGISVLLTLLDPPTSESVPSRRYFNDEASSPIADTNTNPTLCTIILAIEPFLPKFHNLLINPPKKPSFKLSSGEIDPPLGNTRLFVIKLIAVLISFKNPKVNQRLDELNTLQVLLDLFFCYTWNNFLHSQVDKCLAFTLNSSSVGSKEQDSLISNVFLKCRLLERIRQAWDENETEQGKGGRRKGYMGHLIKMANRVSEHVAGNLNDFVKEHVDPDTIAGWELFVKTKLHEVNEVQKRYLGGCHPSQAQPKEDTDYSVTFDSETNGMMSNANLSSSTKNLAENFGGLFTMTSSTDEIGGLDDRKRSFEELLNQRVSDNMIGPSSDDWDPDPPKMKTIADLDISLDDEEVWEQFSPSAFETGGTQGSSDDDDDKPINFKTENIWSSDPWGNQDDESKDPKSDGWANFDIAFNQPSAEIQRSSELANAVPVETFALESSPVKDDVADKSSEEALNIVDNATQGLRKCQISDSVDLSSNELPAPTANVEDMTTTLGNINENVDGTSALPEPLDSESDNNANLKSLTEEPSQNEELYFRICSTKTNATENCDDVPKFFENTPVVNKPSDSTLQPASGDGASVKTGPPPDPV